MLDSAIVVVGTKKIIPALVFAKIGRYSRYSAYIEHYYMHTPNTMILIVEPRLLQALEQSLHSSLKRRIIGSHLA